MGNRHSNGTKMTKDEVNEFVNLSQGRFTTDEVLCLYGHFREISELSKDDGVIDAVEFTEALGLTDTHMEYFVLRAFQIMDTNGDGFINFAEYLAGLATLDKRAPERDKLYFSFRMYDRDDDSKISKVELSDMLRDCVRTFPVKISEEQINILVERTFAESSRAGSSFINFEEYCNLKKTHPMMLTAMSLDVREQIKHFKHHGKVKKRRKSCAKLKNQYQGFKGCIQLAEATRNRQKLK